jgi:nucleoside-diphosphate-sugar epimerase
LDLIENRDLPDWLPSDIRLLEGKRIAILGASGWMGRTLIDLSSKLENISLHLSASTKKQIDVSGFQYGVFKYERSDLEAFQPQIILNCAFLTREKLEVLGSSRFAKMNALLTDEFIHLASLPSVEFAMTLSSGAAVHEKLRHTPYGLLKAEEEARALALRSTGRNIFVARLWSVSGKHVQRPQDYAFSDLIYQAKVNRKVVVKSSGLVYRRYVDAEQFLAVSIAEGINERHSVVDSGGPQVEIRELAIEIAKIHEVAFLLKAPETHFALDSYLSTNDMWHRMLNSQNVRELSLMEQIKLVSMTF